MLHAQGARTIGSSERVFFYAKLLGNFLRAVRFEQALRVLF